MDKILPPYVPWQQIEQEQIDLHRSLVLDILFSCQAQLSVSTSVKMPCTFQEFPSVLLATLPMPGRAHRGAYDHRRCLPSMKQDDL